MQLPELEQMKQRDYTDLPPRMMSHEKEHPPLNYSPLSEKIMHGNDPESEAFVKELLDSMKPAGNEKVSAEIPDHQAVPMALDQAEVQINLAKDAAKKPSFFARFLHFFGFK